MIQKGAKLRLFAFNMSILRITSKSAPNLLHWQQFCYLRIAVVYGLSRLAYAPSLWIFSGRSIGISFLNIKSLFYVKR